MHLIHIILSLGVYEQFCFVTTLAKCRKCWYFTCNWFPNIKKFCSLTFNFIIDCAYFQKNCSHFFKLSFFVIIL